MYFEVLQTSLTFENSENVGKRGYFEKPLRWRAPFLFRSKGGIYRVSCLKILMFWYITSRSVFI